MLINDTLTIDEVKGIIQFRELWKEPDTTTERLKAPHWFVPGVDYTGMALDMLMRRLEMEKEITPVDMSIGTMLYCSGSVPRDYMECFGQEIDSEEYSELFDLIGHTYGAVKGETTFKLPIGRQDGVAKPLPEHDSDGNIIIRLIIKVK